MIPSAARNLFGTANEPRGRFLVAVLLGMTERGSSLVTCHSSLHSARVKDCRHARLDVKFLKEPMEVHLDGLLLDAEHGGELLVTVTAGEQRQQLPLSGSESRFRGSVVLRESRQRGRGGAPGGPRLPCHDARDGAEENRHGLPLAHETGDARAEQMGDSCLRVQRRDSQDRNSRMGAPDLLELALGHETERVEVEKDQVGPDVADQSGSLVASGRAADPEVPCCIQSKLEAFPEETVLRDDQQKDPPRFLQTVPSSVAASSRIASVRLSTSSTVN